MIDARTWEDTRERVLLRWPALDKKDVDASGGDINALVALLEIRLGYARAQAVRDLNAVIDGAVYVPEVADENRHTGTSGPVVSDGDRGDGLAAAS
jgi:hypothetical protein